MGRRSNFIKTKANYTLQKFHRNVSDGVILEHDHVTIQPMEGFFEKDEITMADSIFKFKVPKGGSLKKRHYRGKWAEWTSPDGSESGTEWTLNTESVNQKKKSEKTDFFDYSSITDFTCYGSAVDMVKGSVFDIVMNYPGSIIITDFPVNLTTDDEENEQVIEIKSLIDEEFPDTIFYLVSNEVDIDIDTTNITTLPEWDNPMHYLVMSGNDYVDGAGNAITTTVIAKSEVLCDDRIIAKVDINGVVIYVYYKDGKKILLSKEKSSEYKIVAKPKDSFIDTFFENLDGFGKVLLNNKTKPLYTAILDTPVYGLSEYQSEKKPYVWPTVGNTTQPDFSSPAFARYVDSLVKLAEFHDTYDTDNIWRVITHESLKNLDWSSVLRIAESDEDDTDTGMLEKILHLYGRQFDDLMFYTDNIKKKNSIGYGIKQNIENLIDSVQMDGWVTVNVAPSDDDSILTDTLFPALSKGFSGSDANMQFLKNLKMNSKYLNSMKGSKKGIETMLGLFGLFPKGNDGKGDFQIIEYISAVADSGYPDINKIEETNIRKDGLDEDEARFDSLTGLPLVKIGFQQGDDINEYVVPWFEKGVKYDGNPYFQCNGGWAKTDVKKISLGISSIKEIRSDGNFSLYTETLPYMKFADTIEDMLSLSESNLRSGDICYVTNIQDISKYGLDLDEELPPLETISHYFILDSLAQSNVLGYDTESGCYGWKYVKYEEYDGNGTLTDTGKRILYLESIVTKEYGNNPHVGYGKYDDGKTYMDYFKIVFKGVLDEGRFSTLTDEELTDVKKIGFAITDNITDDKKVHYFPDMTEESKIFLLDEKTEESILDTFEPDDFYENLSNPEGGEKYDEAAANSAINTKRLVVKFFVDEIFFEEERDYLSKVILPYVEQMIPSTTISEYVIVNNQKEYEILPWDKIEQEPVMTIKADGIVYNEGEFDGTRILLNDMTMDKGIKIIK